MILIPEIPNQSVCISIMDLRIESYSTKNGVRHVIRDDLLYGGTKQRAGLNYIKATMTNKTTTLLYTSSYNGYGPVVCALVAKELGLKAIVILSLKAFGNSYNSTVTQAEQSTTVKKCRELGATVIYCITWHDLVQQGKTLSEDPAVYWIPLGFKDKIYVDYLITSLKSIVPPNIKRLWVVGGSGVLCLALSKILPSSTIFLVPVDLSSTSYGKLHSYVSPQSNVKIIKTLAQIIDTPYPTIKGYDSRAWDASVEYGKEGDYVWNVAE